MTNSDCDGTTSTSNESTSSSSSENPKLPKHQLPMYLFDIFLRPNTTWLSTIINYIRQKFWLWFYNSFSRRAQNDIQWQFINYGYVPDDIKDTIKLDNEDDQDLLNDKCGTTCLQLYYEVIKPVLPITGYHIAEIGSGRGGGAVYITKYLQPKSYTGIELSSESVNFANRYQKPKCPNALLHFQQGDAMNIPLPDHAYDVVINVESSHCYSDFLLFLQEVHRILQPSGILVLCDMRITRYVARMEYDMMVAGFDIIENQNITSNILKSFDQTSTAKYRLTSGLVGATLHHILIQFYSNFCAIKGSQMYQSFQSGYFTYKRYVLRKKEMKKVE